MDDFNKASNIYPNLNTILSNEQQFRLKKINEIKDYFLAEIIGKNLSKFIASLDYFDKSLNILSISLGSIVSIASFPSVIGARARIIGASCCFTFSSTSGLVKKFLKAIRNKKKHNKIVMLARSKSNSIENKISKPLTDNEISLEDFKTIINEEKNIEI